MYIVASEPPLPRPSYCSWWPIPEICRKICFGPRQALGRHQRNESSPRDADVQQRLWPPAQIVVSARNLWQPASQAGARQRGIRHLQQEIPRQWIAITLYDQPLNVVPRRLRHRRSATYSPSSPLISLTSWSPYAENR